MTELTQQRKESFTNGKRWIASAKDVSGKWALDGKGFKCGLCGHVFAEGDGVRWVYANGNTPSFCNFFTCDACDGPDVLKRRTDAGLYAKSLDYDEYVLAAEVLKLRAGCSSLESENARLREALKKNDICVKCLKRFSGKHCESV